MKAVDLSFTEPYFLNRPLAAGFDLFQTQNNNQELQTYNLYSLGGHGPSRLRSIRRPAQHLALHDPQRPDL
ncbi:MAG: BamA/TamA family outer membrane protein [Aliidongia sp.]